MGLEDGIVVAVGYFNDLSTYVGGSARWGALYVGGFDVYRYLPKN